MYRQNSENVYMPEDIAIACLPQYSPSCLFHLNLHVFHNPLFSSIYLFSSWSESLRCALPHSRSAWRARTYHVTLGMFAAYQEGRHTHVRVYA